MTVRLSHIQYSHNLFQLISEVFQIFGDPVPLRNQNRVGAKLEGGALPDGLLILQLVELSQDLGGFLDVHVRVVFFRYLLLLLLPKNSQLLKLETEGAELLNELVIKGLHGGNVFIFEIKYIFLQSNKDKDKYLQCTDKGVEFLLFVVKAHFLFNNM